MELIEHLTSDLCDPARVAAAIEAAATRAALLIELSQCDVEQALQPDDATAQRIEQLEEALGFRA